jgi:hypothetical protein
MVLVVAVVVAVVVVMYCMMSKSMHANGGQTYG